LGRSCPVDLGNGVTLDYYEKRDEPIQSQHSSSSTPLSPVWRWSGSPTTPTPATPNPARFNRLFGGRGAYFDDPDTAGALQTPTLSFQAAWK
jgi:hypothetical protein